MTTCCGPHLDISRPFVSQISGKQTLKLHKTNVVVMKRVFYEGCCWNGRSCTGCHIRALVISAAGVWVMLKGVRKWRFDSPHSAVGMKNKGSFHFDK